MSYTGEKLKYRSRFAASNHPNWHGKLLCVWCKCIHCKHLVKYYAFTSHSSNTEGHLNFFCLVSSSTCDPWLHFRVGHIRICNLLLSLLPSWLWDLSVQFFIQTKPAPDTWQMTHMIITPLTLTSKMIWIEIQIIQNQAALTWIYFIAYMKLNCCF